MRNKTLFVVFVVLGAVGFLFGDVLMDRQDRVRKALDLVVHEIYSDPYAHNIILEYGIGQTDNEKYRNLVAEVAYNAGDVLSHFDAYATNQTERLLILSVRDQLDDRFYVSFCNRVVDLAAKGVISRDELLWTVFPVSSEYERYLVRSYRDPATRLLLEKLQRVDGASGEYYQDVLSGKAYEEYVKQVESGLIKDPLIPIRDYPTVRNCCYVAALIVFLFLIFVSYRTLKRR